MYDLRFMSKLKAILIIFFLLGCIPCLLFAQNGTGSKSEKIYYFIDTDCENCSANGHKSVSIWIVTAATYSAVLGDHEALLTKFRNAIATKYGADSALVRHAVFRYQDSMEGIKKAYIAKEAKMVGRGYLPIKIEF